MMNETMTTKPATLTFAKFPKLTNGNDDDGAEIMMGDKRVGYIAREVDWTRALGSIEPRYTAKVTGYRVCLFFGASAEEPVLATLAQARAFARTTLKGSK